VKWVPEYEFYKPLDCLLGSHRIARIDEDVSLRKRLPHVLAEPVIHLRFVSLAETFGIRSVFSELEMMMRFGNTAGEMLDSGSSRRVPRYQKESVAVNPPQRSYFIRVLKGSEDISRIRNRNLDFLREGQLGGNVVQSAEFAYGTDAEQGNRIPPIKLVPQLVARIHVLVNSDIKWRFWSVLPRLKFVNLFN